ncbi:hypothetical protein [Hymenobacter arizonensis]|uniref:hypothetical protein n=1 Tax=Hymenobacter arizonensis TaxID=1227077 RepID=UPI001160D402|nr:hypothetical protein [Hymenobacter arizonensis]
MKKHLLILSFILAIALNAHAQRPASQAFSRADTVRAISNMFSKHRTGGIIWTVVGSAFAIRIITVAASSSTAGGFTSTPAGTATGVALFGGIPAVIGISKLTRFSSARESRLLSEYEAGKTLPAYVQRRLRRSKYFAN